MEKCNLIQGDCLEELKKIPDESIDLVLTDPPYLLKFMQKAWDTGEDSFTENWASAVFPKLKAGAFLVFTMTPRQDLLWRCLAGIEKAGFELRSSGMYWLYHTGFPKNTDMALAIDLKFFREQFEKDNGRKPTRVEIKEWKKSLKVVGQKTCGYQVSVSKKRVEEGHRPNLTKATKEVDILEPLSEEAKKWNGWKSNGLKPAVEYIVVAQKPRTEKTIVGQVLATGAINVDACRIPYASDDDKGFDRALGKPRINTEIYGEANPHLNPQSEQGRFPANLLVSDDALVGEESISRTTDSEILDIRGNRYCNPKGKLEGYVRGYDDSGTANRFYNLDKWAEKNNITLTEDSAFFDVPKPSKAEKNKGLDGFEEKNVRKEDGSFKSLEIFSNQYTDSSDNPTNRGKTPKHKNVHPTCKPITLFCYLAKMFCQPEGTILDPFLGSGTTGISALKMNFNFIGIEKEPDYFKIAAARIKPYLEQTKISE